MNITFIGNCQTVSLCFYFQKLLEGTNYNISWILIADWFKQFLGEWSEKCSNKILDYNESIERIKLSDIIIFQEIVEEKSSICNSKMLNELKKETCVLIKIPSIYFDYSNYELSLRELEEREVKNEVDIRVSSIINKYKGQLLLFTVNHPNTFLFLEIVREICLLLKIDYFSREKEDYFLRDSNYMQLPG